MKQIIQHIPIFYETYGTGTPIVFLHGSGCDHRFMTACLEPVFAQQAGWQRVYLDLPGMGQTPGTEAITGSDDMLAIIVDFLDAVIPGQPFLLVGFSYGGYLCQAVLHRKFEQVAGMALLCPGVNMDPTQRDAPPQTALVEDPALMASLDEGEAEEFAARAVVQSQSVWERFRDEMLSGASIADRAFLTRLRFNCSFDVAALPQPFPRPVLLLTGRQDHIAGYRLQLRLLEQYPRGAFAVLDRAGHLLPIEQPQLLNAFVSEWLERVRESL
jgi:pimeloyl-ACP methyl ester carboxylesterase